MNTTRNLKCNENSWFLQAVDNGQGLSFCVHIFDKATNRIVVKI